MSDSQLRRLAPEIDLAEFTNKNLNLGRPVPSGRIVVPDEVWLDRGVLRWRTRQEPRYREVTQGMLNRFVRLSDARSILSFSQEWGILGMAPGRTERARFISRTMRAKTNDGRERPAYIIVRSLGRKSMFARSPILR